MKLLDEPTANKILKAGNIQFEIKKELKYIKELTKKLELADDQKLRIEIKVIIKLTNLQIQTLQQQLRSLWPVSSENKSPCNLISKNSTVLEKSVLSEIGVD